MEAMDPGLIAALGGLLGGIVLGIAARWGRFCTLSSIEAASFGGDFTGLQSWGLAIAVAILGTYGLDHAGLIAVSEIFYIASPTSILATIAGGGLFGLGMALVGTCGYGCLARMGGGDMKAFVVFLVMGIVAYATLRGFASYPRLGLFGAPQPLNEPASFPHSIAATTGVAAHWIAYAVAIALAGLLLASGRFRSSPRKIIVGLTVGLVIVWGWIATGILAADEFEPAPLESYTYSAPLGETLVYLMTMTGSSVDFGTGAVIGVVIGAFIAALALGQFRWEAADDAREMRRQIFGAALMGFGSVTALGCTIGQGLSAASTLAWSAPVALLSMFVGATFGLNWLIGGSFVDPFRNFFARQN